MRNAALLSLLCFTSLACPGTPPPVEPVAEAATPDVPAAPANPVAAAFGGREGAFAAAGEWLSPEQPNPPPAAPPPNEGSTAGEAPATPDGDAPAPGGSAATTGTEAGLPGADTLILCHCLTYPNRTGGTTVTIKDCFATRAECANARAERLRRRGSGDPPVPACETESRPACDQAVFRE